MTKVIQKWVLERYCILWNNFKQRDFTFKEAEKILKERDLKQLSKILEELRRAGWLTISGLNPKDSRMRMYKLNDPLNNIEQFHR